MSTSSAGAQPAAFAAALRAAIERSGLGLDRIRERLLLRGCQVSTATLSNWQSGRCQPERDCSLAAVRHLEDILGLSPGQLRRLLGQPRPRGRGTRESQMMPLGAELPTRAEVLERLLSRADMRWDHALVRLSQHDLLFVGPDRAPTAHRFRHIVRATQDGPDRLVILHVTERPGEALPRLHVLRSCGIGLQAVDREAGVLVAELLFDHSLLRGETAVVDYAFRFPREIEVDEQDRCWRQLRLHTRLYLLEVQFHRAAIPVSCEEFSEVPGVGGELTCRPARLDARWRAHMLAVDVGPGLFGLRWRWDA